MSFLFFEQLQTIKLDNFFIIVENRKETFGPPVIFENSYLSAD